MDIHPLSAPGIRLAPPTLADAPRVAEYCQDPAIQRWTTVPSPYTLADAEAYVGDIVPTGWAKGTSLTWALRSDAAASSADSAPVLGMVSLEMQGAGSAEVGYAIAADARGHGLAAIAVRALLEYGFGELDLDRVMWLAYVGNWPSRRVAWSCGFRVEGAIRLHAVQRGIRRDAWVGTILRGDPISPCEPWLGEATTPR